MCDLREYSPVGDNWDEVKRHFASALMKDREISRETERVCFIFLRNFKARISIFGFFKIETKSCVFF